MNDKIILQYGDVQINEQEFKTLNDKMPVGDMIIHFHLKSVQIKYQDRKNYFYAFMPCTVQFIQNYPIEMTKSSFENLNLKLYQYIFFPLSDFSSDLMSATHWSLLYIDNTKGNMRLKHFDSLNHSNINPAKIFIQKIKQIFGLENSSVEELKCNHQDNTYDCGVYVMAYIDALLQCQDHTEANRQLTPSLVKDYRHYLRNYIIECANVLKS